MFLIQHVLDNLHIRIDLYELIPRLQCLILLFHLFVVLDLFMLLKVLLALGHPLIVQFFV